MLDEIIIWVKIEQWSGSSIFLQNYQIVPYPITYPNILENKNKYFIQ